MHLIISKWLRRQKCRQKRFLQTELSAPAPYTPNPAIPTYFHTSNAKSYHLKTTAHKQEPLHRLPTFTLLLPLGRYAAPASLQNLQTPDFQTPSPLKHYFPTFHYRTSSSCRFPIFSSLEPYKSSPKHKQDLNILWEASLQVIFPFQGKFPLRTQNHYPHPIKMHITIQ